MTTVVIENEVSRVYGVPAHVRPELEYELSYPVNGFQFTEAYKAGRWNGRRKLFWRGSLYPTGLAGIVCTVLSKHRIPFQVEDRRKVPRPGPGIEFKGEDRPYQKIEDQAVQATRGIINFATGSGKTAVAARIIAKLDLPTLYVVPTKELLYQTSEELARFLDIPIGRIGAGLFEVDNFVTVATVQTIHVTLKRGQNDEKRLRMVQLLDWAQILFIDEAHHLGAKTFYDVARAARAYYKFGLTGTAFRTDGSEIMLRAATGRTIAKVGSSELIREGVLAQTTIHLYDFHDRGNYGSNWYDIYEGGIVYNRKRNNLICRIVSEHLAKDFKVLIIVKRLEHGYALRNILDAVFVHGSVDTEIRRSIREEFNDGDIRCLIATKIYDEGVDLPNMDVLVLAGGGKSQVQALQRVGRALRAAPGKDRAIIVDFLDNQHATLRSHSERRIQIYRSEPEFVIEQKGRIE
jgi:superfamily II DNA or RNA helicase